MDGAEKGGKNLIEMDGGEVIEKSINKGKPISHSLIKF
jgi:hypothetical protein